MADYFELASSMKLGDVIELPSMMPGLSDEKTVIMLVKIHNDESRSFNMSWHGVFVGEVIVRKDSKARFGVSV